MGNFETKEELEAVKATPEWKEFCEGLDQRVKELIEYVDAHEEKYNCSIIILSNALDGKPSYMAGSTLVGKPSSLRGAMFHGMRLPELREILISALLAKAKPVATISVNIQNSENDGIE